MSIKYVKGDATSPQGSGMKIIAHVDNDVGGWGRGFVLAVSKRWKQPEIAYREWYKNRYVTNDFSLGAVQFVHVQDDIYVANMIGQEGVYEKDGVPPIRYDAVRQCLKKVYEFAKEHNASIHSPRFGAGLAGGKWEEIEKIITEELVDRGIDVTIYDFEQTPFGRK